MIKCRKLGEVYKEDTTEKNGQMCSDIGMDGHYAIIGVSDKSVVDESGNKQEAVGIAYLMVQSEKGVWSVSQILENPIGNSNDYFGFAVAIEGTTAMVGAIGVGSSVLGVVDKQSRGAVFVYQRNQTTEKWELIEELRSSDSYEDGRFGYAIGISGKKAIIGSSRNEEQIGVAYIFEQEKEGKWIEKQRIQASDKKRGDGFGSAVAIDGDRILIGALGLESAYFFSYERIDKWVEFLILKDLCNSKGDLFGDSVAIRGDIVVVGAGSKEKRLEGQVEIMEVGSAFVYEKDEQGQWIFIQELEPPFPEEGACFGESLDVGEKHIAVGAYGMLAVFVFSKDETGVWRMDHSFSEKQNRLKDLGIGANVALCGEQLFLGAVVYNN